MKLPFVSRERYEEMKSLLQAQIAELQEDRRRILDQYSSVLAGEKIYAKAEPRKEIEAQDTVKETEEQQRISEVREAVMATGSRNFGAISKYITQKRQSAWNGKNAPSSREAVATLLEESERQGREAARQSEAQPA